ncbi:cytochrome b [Altererythrobacter aerius]|uniref:Cytochrome b n=1 Tax=Tsuneonella aeria TaxID=1837929 RepID=A0A6I4TGF0_9SPHN|nr:cytochrome b/b6 domain-containing protein [Tsuneonella aeria]MXO75716.1 cytochrome b [Tsuneonella aeria]
MESHRYTRPARILHWAVGGLVLGQIALGFVTDAAPRERAESLGELHAELGLLILALMVLRLSWRLAAPPPPLPATVGRWNRLIAASVHRLLYLLIFVMLGSGLTVWMWIGGPLDWFGVVSFSLPDLSNADEFWLSLAGYTHEYGAILISGLAALHISAALWHELVLRDRLIRDRMV